MEVCCLTIKLYESVNSVLLFDDNVSLCRNVLSRPNAGICVTIPTFFDPLDRCILVCYKNAARWPDCCQGKQAHHHFHNLHHFQNLLQQQ
ncbi:hypothetical protein AQUCO_03700042v1 [Aquilegia coerulea]|uniref:Uncharacterized protein n=1 Tax=Aquilegia coerulea TaxID=218851 RepID=A0A2G5CT82_AQUCA|nr:hypothetical protein AQUCO_03700042v1 [Aquilegia coerulea]